MSHHSLFRTAGLLNQSQLLLRPLVRTHPWSQNVRNDAFQNSRIFLLLQQQQLQQQRYASERVREAKTAVGVRPAIVQILGMVSKSG